MTDVRRVGLRQPRSLTSEQLTSLDITTAAHPAAVRAWILWEDGVEELVTGHAIARTRRAINVRWGIPPHILEAWLWAGVGR